MTILKYVIIAAAGYFIGTIQNGIWVARAFGVADIRKLGSGGTGATNVLRNLGLKASAITFFLDALKGAISALIGLWLMGQNGACLGGVCAVIGHIWPVFYNFKGGKGVASSAGALFVISPIVALIGIPLSLVFIAIFRIVSVVSISMTFTLVTIVNILTWGNWMQIILTSMFFILVAYSHRENIKRLINGTEKKIEFKRSPKRK